MVFKIVQIDSDNPVKIKLEVGTHIFGRGKFLNIHDKRISRQHGQFEVTDDSLTIKALHQNPCYYRKREATEAQVLRQNCSITLNSGDKLGLLPTSLWYEVLNYSLAEDNRQPEEKCQESTTQAISVDSGEETDNEELRVNSVSNANIAENDNFETQSTEILLPSDLDCTSDPNGKAVQKETSVQNETVEKTRLSTDYDSNDGNVDEPVSPSLLTSNQDEEENSNTAQSSSVKQSDTPQKRPHSGSEEEENDGVKKVKTEPEEADKKPTVKCDPDGQQAGSSANNAGANAPQAAPLRERCMYGASCYRRNPAHRTQFSHPSDADWGAGAKAPCPYGAACGKRDPRHWRDHDHPPGKDQPPPHAGRKRRRDRSETPPDVNIVTGKRVRRPVMNANWNGSDESDSDPYKTDEESDEWQPSSEHTESQN